MLDLNYVRENIDAVRAAMANRGMPPTVLDDFASADAERRNAIGESDRLNAERNAASREIGALMKDGKRDEADVRRKAVNELKDRIGELDAKREAAEGRIRELLSTLPNIPHASVPVGKDESANVEISRWGIKPEFDFEPKDHVDLGTALGILDLERATKIAGARFAILNDAGARLERALTPLSPAAFAAEVWDVIKDEDWVLANGTAKGWARRLWDWQPERTYGGSGGAGLGYGLPAALGVTLAHRGSTRVCVNLQSDGDALYVPSALYTAAHHRLPLLTVMFNNRTYGNDEEHQEAVAKVRSRPVENKVVGIRIDDPAPDFARIAQGFGVHAEGPIERAGAVGPALRRALRVVKDGAPALVDVITRL